MSSNRELRAWARVCAAVLLALALGYWIGSSGPWRKLAEVQGEMLRVREFQISNLTAALEKARQPSQPTQE